MSDWWRVEVSTAEGALVAIEQGCYGGKAGLNEADLATIRRAAEHLLSFAAGSAEPQPCFYCHGAGQVETDDNGPIGPCPICGPDKETT